MDFYITKSDDLINLTDDDKEKYKGFFIIRPLPRFPLGRSMISPTAFKKKKDILLRDNKGHGHAVLLIGHEDKYDHIALSLADDIVWRDVSDFDKKMVVIDDNQPQYQIGELENLINYNQEYKIAYYVVVLPKYTNLDAQTAFFLSKKVFNDTKVGLKVFGNQWLTRCF